MAAVTLDRKIHEPSALLSERAADALALAATPFPSDVEPAVVAEILADGTVRPAGTAALPSGKPWTSGTLSGRGWTLWWQRRAWEPRAVRQG